MKSRTRNISKIRVSLFIFFIFQSTIFLSWLPLDRGELNPFLTFIGVVPMSMPYSDYKVIASAIQYVEQGGNPYITGDFDVEGRRYNYPAYWLKMPFLGFKDENIKYVYIVFATIFSLGLGLVFWGDKNKAWYRYFPFLFSPPVFLVLERCNYELIVFFLVVLAIWMCRKKSGYAKAWIGGVLLLLATVLKVFPVFGFYIFVRDSWKRTLTFLIPFGIISAAYFAYSRPFLELVHKNTPWSKYLSFGVNVIPYNVSEWISPNSEMLPVYLLAVAWIVAATFIILGFMQGRKSLGVTGMEAYDAYLFRGGSVIYIAVYLMGSNFDYRLIFLLTTLPFIFRMLHEDTIHRSIYLSYLLMMFVAFWFTEANLIWKMNTLWRSTVLLLNELSCWGLLFLCIVLQFKMLPQYVRDIIYRQQASGTP